MDDRELVRQAQKGHGDSYGRLVELHQRRVYATLAKITGDRDLAFDLTQEAFVRPSGARARGGGIDLSRARQVFGRPDDR